MTRTELSASRRVSVPRGYAISEDFHLSVAGSKADTADVVEKGEAPLEGVPLSRIERAWKTVSMGGSVFDGFLLAASQEVGQSILTLPNVFSQVGFAAGISMELFFATLALYTNFLLVSMHAEYRQRLQEDNDPKHQDKFYIASYHEIMGYLVGPWLRKLSIGVVFLALLGLTTVQIIATSSNFYILDDSFSKRDWSLIWGFIFSLIAFVPTFRHYRILSVLGILTTTYTAGFMTIASIVHGQDPGTVHEAPTSPKGFFAGMVQLLFIYGGHSSNVEVADVMDNPASYDRSYFWSYLYVFGLTMPNAVAGYWAFGQEAEVNANAFGLFDRSVYRDFGIVMMTLHQAVAFGLFAGPLFHMWEKMIGVHDRPFIVRALWRLPVEAVMIVFAVAFPFFGAINAILGAFTTTFGTYIIPLVGYNLAFSDDKAVNNMVKKFPAWVDMNMVRWLNWFLAGLILAFGVGAGGFTSVSNFIDKVSQFKFFADCYQC